jgi:hypothetical protein
MYIFKRHLVFEHFPFPSNTISLFLDHILSNSVIYLFIHVSFFHPSIHPSIHSIHSFAQQSFSRPGPRTNAEDAKKKRERILPQASDSVSISWHIDCQICLTEEPGRLSRRKEAVQPKHRRNNSTDRHLDRSGDDK